MKVFAIIVAFLAAVVIASPSSTDHNVVAPRQHQANQALQGQQAQQQAQQAQDSQ
jgi:hypothetical protein